MSPFAPTDVADLWAWFDANEGVTGGTSVTAWADQSGNGNDLSAAGGEEPELVTGVVNGLPVVGTYGLTGNRRLSTSVNFPDLSAGGTVFIVGRQDSVGSTVDNFGCWMGAGGFVNMQIERGGTASLGFGSIAGAIASSNEVETAGSVPEDEFVTIRLLNNVTNNLICFNNGTEVSLASTGASYIATIFSLFKTASGAQGNKQIGDILIYTRELDPSEISDVETYLKDKYNHY